MARVNAPRRSRSRGYFSGVWGMYDDIPYTCCSINDGTGRPDDLPSGSAGDGGGLLSAIILFDYPFDGQALDEALFCLAVQDRDPIEVIVAPPGLRPRRASRGRGRGRGPTLARDGRAEDRLRLGSLGTHHLGQPHQCRAVPRDRPLRRIPPPSGPDLPPCLYEADRSPRGIRRGGGVRRDSPVQPRPRAPTPAGPDQAGGPGRRPSAGPPDRRRGGHPSLRRRSASTVARFPPRPQPGVRPGHERLLAPPRPAPGGRLLPRDHPGLREPAFPAPVATERQERKRPPPRPGTPARRAEGRRAWSCAMRRSRPTSCWPRSWRC